MQAVADERLDAADVCFSTGSACCVVMASDGYPQKYNTGYEIQTDGPVDAEIYIAGAKLENGRLLSSGGRVLGVTATADTLPGAMEKAYQAVSHIHFENAYYRKDIGQRALSALL